MRRFGDQIGDVGDTKLIDPARAKLGTHLEYAYEARTVHLGRLLGDIDS